MDYDGEGVIGEEKFQFGLSSDVPVSARWPELSSSGAQNSTLASGNLDSLFSSSDGDWPEGAEGDLNIEFSDRVPVPGTSEVFERVTISPREYESFFWSDYEVFVKDDLDHVDTDEGNDDLQEIVVDLSHRKT